MLLHSIDPGRPVVTVEPEYREQPAKTWTEHAPPPPPSRITPREIADLLELVRGDSLSESLRYCFAMRDRGVPLEQIYAELLAPVARRLGVMWVEDETDFVEVTIAVGRLQRLIFELRGPPRAPTHDAQYALMTTIPGEQHTLGLHMAAEGMRSAGLDVVTLLPRELYEIELAIRSRRYDYVGISLGSESLIPALHSVIDTVRIASHGNDTKIIVGGAATSLAGNYSAEFLSADCLARDVIEAVAFILQRREELSSV